MNHKRWIALVAVAIALTATSAFAQGASSSTSLTGVVVDKDGGVIPGADFAHLKALGVREIFTPGSTLANICACIHRIVGR